MEDDQEPREDSRLVLGSGAAAAFWRFYRGCSVFVLLVFWIIAPVLGVTAYQQADYSSVAFVLTGLFVASLASLAFVRIANRALLGIREKQSGVRRMV